jgi:multidrug resistance efflux pump
MEDFIKTIYEKAESELEAAQKAYDQILADPEYEDILEARARVSVAKERYDLARDYLYQQFTGEYSLDVQAAETSVAQAEAGILLAQAQITQAENNRHSAETTVTQAEAALELVNLQLEKLQVYSPITGVILTKTIDPGEILAAGYTALTVGDLSHLTVTVYLPEDMYGQIKLGDIADLTIDSFPDEVFKATVMRIADEAEYTPRNVQTQEERQNTVYAIELAVKNIEGKLKPGMPADVVFQP